MSGWTGRSTCASTSATCVPPRSTRSAATPSKAEQILGWKATVDGAQLAQIMVDADIEALEHEGRPWIDRVDLPDWPATP